MYLSFLLDFQASQSLRTTMHSYYYAHMVHFWCTGCTVHSSLQRPVSEYRPSHTYGTCLWYGCCAGPHASYIGHSASLPCRTSWGFGHWTRPSVSWRNLLHSSSLRPFVFLLGLEGLFDALKCFELLLDPLWYRTACELVLVLPVVRYHSKVWLTKLASSNSSTSLFSLVAHSE